MKVQLVGKLGRDEGCLRSHVLIGWNRWLEGLKDLIEL